MNDLVKYHIFLIINMEVMWWVPLIFFFTKAIFGLDTDLLYHLSNRKISTLNTMKPSFMTYIYNSMIEKNTLMMMKVVLKKKE